MKQLQMYNLRFEYSISGVSFDMRATVRHVLSSLLSCNISSKDVEFAFGEITLMQQIHNIKHSQVKLVVVELIAGLSWSYRLKLLKWRNHPKLKEWIRQC